MVDGLRTMSDIHDIFAKAKVNLYHYSPILCAIIYNLDIVFNKEIETAGTDGKHLYINPDFFIDLTPEERVFILGHEAGHVLYLHGDREGNRNHKEWNIAGDAVINKVLIDSGAKAIKGCVTYESLNEILGSNVFRTYDDKCTEEVYDLIHDKIPQEILDGCKSDIFTNKWDSNEAHKTVEASKALEDKNFSRSNDEMKRALETLHKPLPWYRVLWNRCEEKAKDDYSWLRPSRRYSDIYLPGLYSDALSCNVYIDNSGSIGNDILNKFYDQLTSIKQAIHVTNMDVYFWSEIITDHYHFNYDDPVKIEEIHSTGGTDISCLNVPKTGINIILTDGYFYDVPEIQNRKDIIWVIYENTDLSRFKGTTIRMEY